MMEAMVRQAIGSVVATLSGWILGWVSLILLSWTANNYFHHLNWYLVRGALAMLPMMGILIVPVWAFIVLPIYLHTPRGSIFWNPFVCVPLGAFAGFIGVQGFFAYDDFFLYHSARHAFDIVWVFAIPGSIVGAITALVATVTYRWFNASLSLV